MAGPTGLESAGERHQPAVAERLEFGWTVLVRVLSDRLLPLMPLRSLVHRGRTKRRDDRLRTQLPGACHLERLQPGPAAEGQPHDCVPGLLE